MTSNKLKDLYSRAGFDIDECPMPLRSYIPISYELETLINIVVAECTMAAEMQARSFSDGDAGAGCNAAANAVRAYGEQLTK